MLYLFVRTLLRYKLLVTAHHLMGCRGDISVCIPHIPLMVRYYIFKLDLWMKGNPKNFGIRLEGDEDPTHRDNFAPSKPDSRAAKVAGSSHLEVSNAIFSRIWSVKFCLCVKRRCAVRYMDLNFVSEALGDGNVHGWRSFTFLVVQLEVLCGVNAIALPGFLR